MNIFPGRQAGVTLPELMIAMVIGLVLMGGMIQVFLGSKASYSVQERLGDLQENGRYALHFMQRSVRMAGFPKSAATGADVVLDPRAQVRSFISAPTAIFGANFVTAEGGGMRPDRVAVEFVVPTGGWVDCVGQNVNANAVLTEQFFIRTDPTPPPGEQAQNQLVCQVVSTTNPRVQVQPLLDGIENMQIQYGIDRTADGYADQYLRADQIGALLETWNNIVSVRVAVLASAMRPVYGGEEDPAALTRLFSLLDVNGIPAPVLTDAQGGRRAVRAQVFTSTIEIRNRSGARE